MRCQVEEVLRGIAIPEGDNPALTAGAKQAGADLID